MEIRQIMDKTQWDGFLAGHKHTPFAQSWAWGEILVADGKKVERLAIADGEKIIALAQVSYAGLPFGWRYVFCPVGPVILNAAMETEIYRELAKYLMKQKCIFARVEPQETKLAALRPTHDVNPRATLVLDITRPKEEITNGMHPKTRYNIRLAQKKNLIVSDKKDFDGFIALMRSTGERDGFRLHDEAHYRHVFESENVYQLSAYLSEGESAGAIADDSGRAGDRDHSGRAVATAVFIGFGDTFTYLYGASDYDHREFMAPHLLQWEGIVLAKKLGYKHYDFFGVAPKVEVGQSGKLIAAVDSEDFTPSRNAYAYDSRHQYAGVTRFKQGFGGYYIERAGTRDLAISPVKYGIYRFLRVLRRIF